ncbi:hypothetical protein [Pseudomonas oryzihabitans]|uniref:hypothetical protein n=1 Tax=Pseudomonas oryzihabitans TaxID=47885 RepID=UPI002893D5E2|nr:hypothetical protein [Pseudomonas oryzihabitans]MDT3722434.1 hypothetical protein [Pseudomonas oryzihabitans]
MESGLKRYLSKLRPELLAMVRAVEPALWERIRDATEEEQVNALANSYAVMQGISHQALGQAGFEQGSLIQRRGEQRIYCLQIIKIDWDARGRPERIFFYGHDSSKGNAQMDLLGKSSEFTSMRTGLCIDGPDLLRFIR